MYGVEGSAVIRVNFKEYTLDRASVLVASDDNIVIFKQKSSDFKVQCYLIEKPFASDIAFDLPNHLFSFLHDYPVQTLDQVQCGQLRAWDAQCQYILHSTVVYQRKLMCNHFQNLFLMIAEGMDRAAPQKDKKIGRKEELCWTFWDLIGKHAKMHRDVSFYADQLCITPFYLSQITKSILNDGPKELINRQVILEIKALLKYTDKSIRMLADELHFVDPSYMGRYFRRETGMSLTDFRKSL